jgi:hypothetical protein
VDSLLELLVSAGLGLGVWAALPDDETVILPLRASPWFWLEELDEAV